MTVQKLKCSGCGCELEYSYDSTCGVRSIVVHCPVCSKKTCVAVPTSFTRWGDPNFLPLTTVAEVIGKVAPHGAISNKYLPPLPSFKIAEDVLDQFNKMLSPQASADYSAPPKPPPAKWQVPKKSKNFDGLRKELDDLHVQLDEVRVVLIAQGKSIRSLQTEAEALRTQLSSAFNDIRSALSRIAVLEKRPPNLDPQFHRAFPERPNYVEWVSEDEELLEEGYNGFPKSKERVVF